MLKLFAGFWVCIFAIALIAGMTRAQTKPDAEKKPAAPTQPVKLKELDALKLQLNHEKEQSMALRNRISQLEGQVLVLQNQLLQIRSAGEREQFQQLQKDQADLEKTVKASYPGSDGMTVDYDKGELDPPKPAGAPKPPATK